MIETSSSSLPRKPTYRRSKGQARVARDRWRPRRVTSFLVVVFVLQFVLPKCEREMVSPSFGIKGQTRRKSKTTSLDVPLQVNKKFHRLKYGSNVEGKPNQIVGTSFDEVAYHERKNFGQKSCCWSVTDLGAPVAVGPSPRLRDHNMNDRSVCFQTASLVFFAAASYLCILGRSINAKGRTGRFTTDNSLDEKQHGKRHCRPMTGATDVSTPSDSFEMRTPL